MQLTGSFSITLEARRERILIAYLDQLPYTYRALLKYLSIEILERRLKWEKFI